MFKLWIDRYGDVQTFSRGSLDEQHNDLVKVLAYLKGRVTASERIVEDSTRYRKKEAKNVR